MKKRRGWTIDRDGPNKAIYAQQKTATVWRHIIAVSQTIRCIIPVFHHQPSGVNDAKFRLG